MPCLVEGASLDCLASSLVGCGDFAESEAVFLCSLFLPKTESGLDETFLPRKMQECDKECKQAGDIGKQSLPSSIVFSVFRALYILWVSFMRYVCFRQKPFQHYLSLDLKPLRVSFTIVTAL